MYCIECFIWEVISEVIFISLASCDSWLQLDVKLWGLPDIDSIVQFVAGSQPMNALAFVLDGLYYGVSDFEYAAYSMVLFLSYHTIA